MPVNEHPYFTKLRDNAIKIMTALIRHLTPSKPVGGTPQMLIAQNLPVSRLSLNKKLTFLGKRAFSSGKGTCGEDELSCWSVGGVLIEGWGLTESGGMIKELIRKRERKWLNKQITNAGISGFAEVASQLQVDDLEHVVFGKEIEVVDKKEETDELPELQTQ